MTDHIPLPHQESDAEHHGANASTPHQASPNGKRGLFDQAWWRDWAFLLGAATVTLGTWADSRDSIHYNNLTTYDLTALTVDTLFISAINFTVFGLLPASIRRRLRNRRGTRTETSSARLWNALGLAIVFGGLGTFMGMSTTSSTDTGGTLRSVSQDFAPAPSETRCDTREGDKRCVTVRTIDSRSAQIEISFNYIQPRIIDGQQVAALTWTGTLDCGSRRGTVNSLTTQDAAGRPVQLSAESTTAMVNGIEQQQLPAIVERSCAPVDG